jgi:hypothetical protein
MVIGTATSIIRWVDFIITPAPRGNLVLLNAIQAWTASLVDRGERWEETEQRASIESRLPEPLDVAFPGTPQSHLQPAEPSLQREAALTYSRACHPRTNRMRTDNACVNESADPTPSLRPGQQVCQYENQEANADQNRKQFQFRIAPRFDLSI